MFVRVSTCERDTGFNLLFVRVYERDKGIIIFYFNYIFIFQLCPRRGKLQGRPFAHIYHCDCPYAIGGILCVVMKKVSKCHRYRHILPGTLLQLRSGSRNMDNVPRNYS